MTFLASEMNPLSLVVSFSKAPLPPPSARSESIPSISSWGGEEGEREEGREGGEGEREEGREGEREEKERGRRGEKERGRRGERGKEREGKVKKEQGLILNPSLQETDQGTLLHTTTCSSSLIKCILPPHPPLSLSLHKEHPSNLSWLTSGSWLEMTGGSVTSCDWGVWMGPTNEILGNLGVSGES